jgi:hypothetical protein
MSFDDIVFKTINLIFNFIFWIILDRERFWTAWFIFAAIVTIFSLFLIKSEIDDKKSNRS